MPLTADIIENAEPHAKPYKLHDGGGMFLLVMPAGGKWWRIKYRFRGKQNQLSLGVYPETSLTDARTKCAELKALLADGADPSATRRAERAARIAEEIARGSGARYTLDSDGALTLCLGDRRFTLSPSDTGELRGFLDATRRVALKANRAPN